MDNLCHTLVGAAFGEAGLKRRTRYGNATLMLASNLPDVDVLVFFTDVASVSFRRGWTHGVPAQLLLPAAFTALVWLFHRFRGTDDPAKPPLRPGAVLLLAYIGVCSHVLLDLLNTYGVRLLAPLEWRWFYGDAVFIIDPWLWLALGAGVWLARRQRRAMPARGALAFAAAYILVMVISARAAQALVADLWRQTRGVEPRALMVGPVPINPFRRQVIVDAGEHYETGQFAWLPVSITFDGEQVPKNESRPEVATARATSVSVREFLVWSRFPFYVVTPRADGTEVAAFDMRFPDAVGASGATFAGRVVLPRR